MSIKSFRKVQPLYASSSMLFGAVLMGTACSAGNSDTANNTSDSQMIHIAEGGEGNEGGKTGVKSGSAAQDFLVQVSIIKGHLLAANTLYQMNMSDHAATHSKHPQSEIYAELDFAGVQAPEFDQELTDFAQALESRAPKSRVDQAHAALEKAVENAINTVSHDPGIIAQVINHLVRTAAEEYRIGVRDGVIVNLHEYQDAWGFIRVAHEWNTHLVSSSDARIQAAAQDIAGFLDTLMALQNAVMPDDTTKLATISEIYGLAARIELASLRISRA